MMKKWMQAAVVGALAVCLASCGGKNEEQGAGTAQTEATTEAKESQDPGTQESQGAEPSAAEGEEEIPNPFVEQEKAEDLKAVEVSMDAPEGALDVKYYLIDDEIAEITFTLEDNKFSYRGAAHAEDFAGIFEEFEEDVTALSDCGADEDLIIKTTVSGGRLASWSKNGAKYTLYTPSTVADEDLFTLCIELIGKN